MIAREELPTQSLELAREELAAVLAETVEAHARRADLMLLTHATWAAEVTRSLLASPALANLHDPFPQANPYVTTDKGPKEELIATQRQEFGSSWDELVPTEGRTLGWIIESVITDVLDNCQPDTPY